MHECTARAIRFFFFDASIHFPLPLDYTRYDMNKWIDFHSLFRHNQLTTLFTYSRRDAQQFKIRKNTRFGPRAFGRMLSNSQHGKDDVVMSSFRSCVAFIELELSDWGWGGVQLHQSEAPIQNVPWLNCARFNLTQIREAKMIGNDVMRAAKEPHSHWLNSIGDNFSCLLPDDKTKS